MKRPLAVRTAVVFLLGSLLGATGCMTAYKKSVGANTDEVFSRVYRSDFNTAWQATLDALTSVRLDVTNRDSGSIQTRWIDNTVDRNMTDGDGTTSLYMKAQYRYRVTLASGEYQGDKGVKVSVQREQIVQRDALDDFRPLESDGVEEKTLLYRIGRIVAVRKRLATMEEERTNKELMNSDFTVPEESFEGNQ